MEAPNAGGGFLNSLSNFVNNPFGSPFAGIAGEMGAQQSGSDMTGTMETIPYKCHYYAGGRNNPSYLDITLAFAYPETIIFRRENIGDVISKKIGLTKEEQSGNPKFDKDIFVDCDVPAFADSFIASEEKRSAIEAMFASVRNLKIARLTPTGMKVRITPCTRFSNIVCKGNILEVLRTLVNLTKSVPPAPIAARTAFVEEDDVAKYKRARITLFSIAGASAAAAVIMMASASHYDLVENSPAIFLSASLKYSLPPLILFLYIAFSMIKGRSSSGRMFLYILLLSAPGFIVTAMCGLASANGYMDKSPEVTRIVTVINKYESHGKTTSYYVYLAPWDNKYNEIKLSVNSSFYSEVDAGSQIIMTTKPGYFNTEWIVSYYKK